MANNFYTYKIVFDDGEGGNEAPASPSRPENQNEINPKKPTEKKGGGSSGKSSGSMAIAISVFQKLGSDAVSFITSNIERRTGSSLKQNNVSSAMKVMGYGVAMASNPYLGGAMIAVDMFTTTYDYIIEKVWENVEANEYARRLGVANNRSR